MVGEVAVGEVRVQAQEVDRKVGLVPVPKVPVRAVAAVHGQIVEQIHQIGFLANRNRRLVTHHHQAVRPENMIDHHPVKQHHIQRKVHHAMNPLQTVEQIQILDGIQMRQEHRR